MTCGFLYIVYGNKKYHREAEVSCRSIKKHHPHLPVAIITDKLENVDTEFAGWDEILPYPEKVCHDKDDGKVDGKFEFKVDCMGLSPFEQTLFLDTDTFCTGPLQGLFSLLSYFDFALLPKSGEGDIRDPAPPYQVVQGFTPYNTGVIAWRKSSASEAVFERWKEYYRTQRVIQRSKNDQAYFLLALAKTPNVKVHAIPTTYNARFNGFLGLTGYVKLLHAAGMKTPKEAEFEQIAEAINATNENRGWDAKKRKVRTK